MKRYLGDTSLPLARIATLTGFNHVEVPGPDVSPRAGDHARRVPEAAVSGSSLAARGADLGGDP